MRRKLLLLLAGLLLLVLVLATLVHAVTFHPREVQDEPVHCAPHAPLLETGRPFKVLSWNVQYMAGKGYVFFYDLLDGSGPDERPSRESVARTLGEVARVIGDESPDFLLLQELDDGAARTDKRDQLADLLKLLPPDYACHASAFYWRGAYVPHPRIRAAVGMKLSVVSRYRLSKATRYALPGSESADPLSAQFDLKRAILEVRVPSKDGAQLALLDTHLAAFAQGSDTMERQVAFTVRHLQSLDAQAVPWILGGDLNLLPPGEAYRELPPRQQAYYRPETELRMLVERWPAVPSLDVTTGSGRAAWFTHFPNDPTVGRPDRTIDYLLYSRALKLVSGRVRQQDTQAISDHLPIVAGFER